MLIINVDDIANKYCRQIVLIYHMFDIMIYCYVNNTEI